MAVSCGQLWLLLSWAAVAAITAPAMNGWGFSLWALWEAWEQTFQGCAAGPCEHSLHWGQLGCPAPAPIPARNPGFYRCWVSCSSVLGLLWELIPLLMNKMKTQRSSYCVSGCWDQRHPQLLQIPHCSGCCRAPTVPKTSCLVRTKQQHAVTQHQHLSAHLHFSIP